MSPCTESESPALATVVLWWVLSWICGLPGTCRPQAENYQIRLSLVSEVVTFWQTQKSLKDVQLIWSQKIQSEEPVFLYLFLCYEGGCCPCKGTQLLFVSKILNVLGRTLPLGNAVTRIISDLTLAASS